MWHLTPVLIGIYVYWFIHRFFQTWITARIFRLICLWKLVLPKLFRSHGAVFSLVQCRLCKWHMYMLIVIYNIWWYCDDIVMIVIKLCWVRIISYAEWCWILRDAERECWVMLILFRILVGAGDCFHGGVASNKTSLLPRLHGYWTTPAFTIRNTDLLQGWFTEMMKK
jgi:hypothetical protein